MARSTKTIDPARRYNPPPLDMSPAGVARRRRIWIAGDRRAPFAYADTPTNRHIPPSPLLPARVEYRPRFNENEF